MKRKIGGAFFTLLYPLILIGSSIIAAIGYLIYLVAIKGESFLDVAQTMVSGDRGAILTIITDVLGVTFAWLVARFSKGIRIIEKTKFDLKITILSIFIAFGGVLGLEYLGNILFPNSKPAENPLVEVYTVLIVIAAAFAAPIVEELIFRKFIIQTGEKFGVPNWVLIFISAITFALCHDITSALYTFVTFALGAVLAFIYCYTHNIFYCMIIHFINNAVCCIYLYWSEHNEAALEFWSKEIFSIIGLIVWLISVSLMIILLLKKRKEEIAVSAVSEEE